MPRTLASMQKDKFEFVLAQAKKVHENLFAAEQSIVEYGLETFLSTWTDAHMKHLSAMVTFSNEIKGLVVEQGIANKFEKQSEVEKGKARSSNVIKSRNGKKR